MGAFVLFVRFLQTNLSAFKLNERFFGEVILWKKGKKD